MPDKVFVDELEEGQHVQTTFLVSRKQLDTTRHGDPYLRLTLRDKTGDIESRVWDDADQMAERFDADDFVVVRAKVSSYKGELQLKVDDIQPIDADETNPADFMPQSRWEPDELFAQLTELLDTHLESPAIRRFIDAFFDDEERIRAYKRAPAATSNHHNYIGGLLEHSLSMARLGLQISDHYAKYYPDFVDSDLVLAGCVLHDVGKIDELDYERSFNYSTQGQLVGHVAGGATLVHQVAESLDPPLDDTLVDHLQHLVLSHHGRREYGAPVPPRTPEALVLHHIDLMDSKTNMWHAHVRDHRNGADGDDAWTDYNRTIESSIYAGPGERPDWAADPAHADADLSGPGRTDGSTPAPAAGTAKPEDATAGGTASETPDDTTDDDPETERDDHTLSMFEE